MVKKGIFLNKLNYRETPFFKLQKTRRTPEIDQIIIDKVLKANNHFDDKKSFTQLIEESKDSNLIMTGFISSNKLRTLDPIKEYLPQNIKENLFAIRQNIVPNKRFYNEFCFFRIENEELKNNSFVETDNTPIELEGKVKQIQTFPRITYIEVDKIKRINPSRFMFSNPEISYPKLIKLFYEIYGNQDFAEALVINLIASAHKEVKSPVILPLNKTYSPDYQIATDTKKFHKVIKSDLNKLFNPFYFESANPLIHLNWMDNSEFSLRYTNEGSLNIYASNDLMSGNEIFNTKSIHPIFLNSKTLVNYEEGNILIDLKNEITSSLLHYKLKPKNYSINDFDLDNTKSFKNLHSSMEDRELKLFLGSSSPDYLNNPSVFMRTGGNFLMGNSLNKVSDSPNKEVSRINENTFVAEFQDVIPKYEETRLIKIGTKFMRIHNSKMKNLIKELNERINSGNNQGIDFSEMTEFLRKMNLKNEHIYQAMDLGILVWSFNKKIKPHYYHLDI